MTDFRADLHCHSNCSDGSDDPLTLLELAKQTGLSGLSITDHDTIHAYTPELYAKAKELDIELLIGTEISTEFEGLTVHILAYGFDETLGEFLDEALKKRQERNRVILLKLKKKGIIIEESELRLHGPDQIIGRPHIAAVLLQRGIVSSIQEAFERYLKDTAPCYSIGGKFTPREAIGAIKQAKGKAVLAHPHFIKKGRFLRELLSHSFNGIECHYGRLHREQEKPWIKIAKEKGWIATGGSDYHGKLKPYIQLGCSWVDEETFRKLTESREETAKLCD
jgi:predicted metal-dependent phosphoesterase TrpH